MISSCNEVDDIEDLISSNADSIERERNVRRFGGAVIRTRKSKGKNSQFPKYEPLLFEANEPVTQSIIPGTQTIYMKTWGCTHNHSDSEYMAGLLQKAGYKLTNERDEADLWLLNSCTVKNPSEDTFRNDVQAGLSKSKYVVVGGCVPQGAPKSEYLKGLSVIGVNQFDRVVDVVEETLKGHTVRLLQRKKKNGKVVAGPELALPKVRKNPLIEIIPINSGCLNQCTYCKTKHARGDLVSYTPEEIVERAKQAFNEGCCEIWISSEDTGTYGRDIGTSLPELLWKLVEVIPEHCMMRIGMTNPPYILEHLEEISKILKHPCVYSYIHLPVQSGSDSVLSDMKRGYCRKDFEHVVEYLRENVPNCFIATDIICGFPTEEENDMNETMDLCEKYKFPSLFINQFYPRPGTPAAKMKRIPQDLVKLRTKRLTELFYSYEPYKNKIGEIYKVLVTEISHDKMHYVGHNKYYEQILLPMTNNLLGKSMKVRIIAAEKFCMIGEIIESEEKWINCSKINSNIIDNNQSTCCNAGNDQSKCCDSDNNQPTCSTSHQIQNDQQEIENNASQNNDDGYKSQMNMYVVAYALIALFLAIVYRIVWKVLQQMQ